MGTEAGVFIEGLALSFDWDRDGEMFLDNGLDEAIAKFMANPVLAWSHQKAVAEAGQSYVTLGAVQKMERRPDGLHIVAYVPRPEPGTFLADVYSKLKAGMMRGLSVGGKWLRKAGGVLDRLDIQEVSIASKPVNPNTLIRKVWPAAEGPLLGPALAGAIGHEGKAAAGTFDLNLALHSTPFAEFAAGIRELRRDLEAYNADRRDAAFAELDRSMARLRACTGR
jgi:hypothetical protein